MRPVAGFFKFYKLFPHGGRHQVCISTGRLLRESDPLTRRELNASGAPTPCSDDVLAIWLHRRRFQNVT